VDVRAGRWRRMRFPTCRSRCGQWRTGSRARSHRRWLSPSRHLRCQSPQQHQLWHWLHHLRLPLSRRRRRRQHPPPPSLSRPPRRPKWPRPRPARFHPQPQPHSIRRRRLPIQSTQITSIGQRMTTTPSRPSTTGESQPTPRSRFQLRRTRPHLRPDARLRTRGRRPRPRQALPPSHPAWAGPARRRRHPCRPARVAAGGEPAGAGSGATEP